MRNNNKYIDLSHGSGGRATHQLIETIFKKHFNNSFLKQNNDNACLTFSSERLVISTDSHVVSPLFFPGGDIGSLAVNGTVNDVAMSGAKPLYLSAAFILEEGFPLADLERIVISMARSAEIAGVDIVCGDTKVVERGNADGVYINTTGVGSVENHINISGDCAQPGDTILINGSLGDHGIAVMAHRENLSFTTSIQSDCAALNDLVSHMVSAVPDIHCLRDPTRGGLATTLNELAQQSQVGMRISESQFIIKPQVSAACELLGLDPLYVANEGKLLCICPPHRATELLKAMRDHPLGKESSIIGEVTDDPHHLVEMKTKFGGARVVDWLVGEQLPRIC